MKKALGVVGALVVLAVILAVGFVFLNREGSDGGASGGQKDKYAGYNRIITLKKGDIKVVLLSRGNEIKSGNNKIKVVIEPPQKIKEFYFYMPPMPGMDEMRDAANLKEVAPGEYEGTLKISMDGPWQIRAVLMDDSMITENVFVPLQKGAVAEGGGGHGSHISVKPGKRQLVGIVVEPVSKLELVKTFTTVGFVDYDLSKIYDVTVRADAWIEETFGRFEGEFVKKGAPLMRLLSPEIEIARQELELAKKKGDGELIRKAKEKLDYLQNRDVVRSPVSGVILKKKVYEGGFVKEGMTAYRIADISRVWIIAEVPLKEAVYASKGTPVFITPEDNPDEIIEGEVDYIFPEADRMARTIKVRVSVKNKGITLKPNSLVSVEFERELGEAVAVPETAVVDTGKRQVVFVEVEEGMFMPKQVKLGRKAEGYYQVLHGLKEGDRVVVRGTFLLDSEAQIRGLYGAGGGAGHHH